MGRVTMADIAREAGVSSMTVSRVINGKGEISDATRLRVEEVIRRLNYRPSLVARSLTKQRTNTIGLVIPDITNPFFPEVVRGVEDTAAENGYAVILSNTSRDRTQEEKALHALDDMRVDGVILCSIGLGDGDLSAMLHHQHRAVLFDRCHVISGARSVELDDVYGGMAAANHLMDNGCESLGFLAGPNNMYASEQRSYGFKAAAESRGCVVQSIECAANEKGGYDGAKALLQTNSDITGLFCFNDLMAVGALQACADLGLQVPDDVALIGFDDIRLASLVTPRLTTLAVAKYELGRTFVEVLLDLELTTPVTTASDGRLLLKPHLTPRESTDFVRKRMPHVERRLSAP